jgi:predicted transcriptional regulator
MTGTGGDGPMSVKEAVAKLLETLPDDATIEDVQYHLYVLQKIHAGQKAADEGKTIPHEDVMRELAKWLK